MNHSCSPSDAAKIYNWLMTRGGILIWESANLSNPGAGWTTPFHNEDGTPTTKPSWEAADKPVRHISDPAEVDVINSQVVKRFHVATRMGSNGFAIKVSDGGTRRIRNEVSKALEKHKKAWYEFDYGSHENVVILAESYSTPIQEWSAQAVKDYGG